MSGPLLEADVLDAVGLLLVAALPGQRTEPGTLNLLRKKKISKKIYFLWQKMMIIQRLFHQHLYLKKSNFAALFLK